MQLAVVSGVFLTVLLLGDMLWALSAGTARQLLEKHAAARNKITGGILVAAAIGLALSRRGS
jgi:threonine/homoserine/homoserine lactone efflux protein